MIVSKLIEKLKKMPQDVEVGHVWDGGVGSQINFVWLAKNGEVVTADYGHNVYDADDRPINAPNEEKDLYWKTPYELHDKSKIKEFIKKYEL